MARYTTYKSGIVSGSGLIAASVATSAVFGTASYVLNAVSASFAKNASGSWLSSSFGTSLSALSVIGFGANGNPLTVFPAQDSLYLTVVDGNVGWSSLDSAISDGNYTEDSLFTELGVYSQSLNFADPNIVNSDSVELINILEIQSTPNSFTFTPNDVIDSEVSQIIQSLSGSLVTSYQITSYTTSSI